MRTPEERDVCLTGKEKVNASSLFTSSDEMDSCPSFSINLCKDDARKSKRTCESKINKEYITLLDYINRAWNRTTLGASIVTSLVLFNKDVGMLCLSIS